MTETEYDIEAERLLDAWREWNAAPATPRYAADMDAACVPLARRLGIAVPQFRNRLNDAVGRQLARHPYSDPAAALAEVLAE